LPPEGRSCGRVASALRPSNASTDTSKMHKPLR
jgi:hypothetical protein